MRLLIAIPALNEENSIESIVSRSLDARQFIVNNSPVTDVEITVVSDGSTDRTVERARQYADRVRLIVFEQNRGYGSAIKKAWDEASAELLGFLDADGTCDPRFFSDLCNTLFVEQADLVLGCRLNKGTQMPLVRKIGNFVFASILTVLSQRRVRDAASGMRVLRREAYQQLLPLPNGLNFTPAMSARALLGASGRIKLVEIAMPYAERVGKSKLRLVVDGLRFLRVILETALLYHPERLLAFPGFGFLTFAFVLMFMPAAYHWNAPVQEPTLNLFIWGHVAITVAFLLFSAALLTRRVVQIVISNRGARQPAHWIDKVLTSPVYWIGPLLLVLVGISLVGPNLVSTATNHGAYKHWPRFITGSFSLLIALILISTRVLTYFLDLVGGQLDHLRSQKEQVVEPEVSRPGST
jgi:glycosyltransferase involved in cell wall biosynthesis